MKKLIRSMILISMFLFTGCVYPLVQYKPQFITYIYKNNAYAIIENNNINRMGIKKDDIRKMDGIIKEKYKISFLNDSIYSNKNSTETFNINFFNDLKYTVNGKEYVIPKEKIRKGIQFNEITYIYEPPIDIIKTNDNEYILDIGEIEITDSNGTVILKRKKIPPILFKKTYYRIFAKDPHLSDYDVYYDGWAEDYPKEPNSLKKLYNSYEQRIYQKRGNM